VTVSTKIYIVHTFSIFLLILRIVYSVFTVHCFSSSNGTWYPCCLSYWNKTRIFELSMARQIRWCTVFVFWSFLHQLLTPFIPAYFFPVVCVISLIINKFRFSQYVCLCELSGFLLRRSHTVWKISFVIKF